MQKNFFLSKNGSHVGPYSFEDVLKKLESREHQWMDYVFDEATQDWMMLMEHADFTAKFNEGFARPAAQHAIKVERYADVRPENRLRHKEWFLLKNGNNYGPFSTLDLVQMLQAKTLFEHDYVWQDGMPAWKRVAEMSDFKPDRIRELKHSGDTDVSEIFFRRRHARANYGCSLIVHNSKAVYRGTSLEISEGGAGVMVEDLNLDPGQNLYLHFQPGDGVPPFNAVCVVVSKQWMRDGSAGKGPVKYGVKFNSLSQTTRQSIRDFTEKRKAA